MDFFRFAYSLITAACIVQTCSAEREPACSKFDYDEKLLEKMIRMEIKVEEMMDNMKQAKETFKSLTTDLARRVENVEKSAAHFQEYINETIQKFVTDMKQEKHNIRSLVENAASVPVVAFNARRSSSVTASTNTVIVFDTVILNEGKGYDRATGIFTTPQTGLYYLAAHICNSGNKYVYFAIVVENNQITSSTHYNDVYSCSSVTAVAMLKSGERVWIISTFDSEIYHNDYRWNSFVGALLNQ